MRKHGRYEIAYPAHAHDRISEAVEVNGPYLPVVIVLVFVIAPFMSKGKGREASQRFYPSVTFALTADAA